MNESILEQIRSCPNLPSLPSVAMQVVDMTAADDVDINKLADLITADPALTTKILKTVNSPFYGLSKNVSTVSQSLVILGLQSVKTLVLGFSLVRNLRSHEDSQFDYQSYWRRSIYAAVAARAIAIEVKLVQREEAFLAALLQDVGMPVLHIAMGTPYDTVVSEVGPNHQSLAAAEQQALGTTHAEVAAHLVTEWKLPPMLGNPIEHHHDPDSAPDELKMLTRVVHLAGLCAELFMDHVTPQIVQNAKDYAHEQFGLDDQALADLMATISDNTREMAKLFKVPVGDQRGYEEILSRANEQLIRLSLESQQQASKMESRARAFEEQANTDALTGIANRKRFAQELREAFARAKKFLRPLSILVIDADHFKSINDTHGHDAGDRVLIHIASTLTEAARSMDLAARYGGEEFVLIMPETPLESAASLAESIRAVVATEPFVYEQTNINVTISVGVATCGDGITFPNEKAFFRAADAAVYKAKGNGRNRVEVAETGPSAAAARSA